MPMYSVYGKVVGKKHIGDYEAESELEAIAMAGDGAYVSLCSKCEDEVNYVSIDGFQVEEIEE